MSERPSVVVVDTIFGRYHAFAGDLITTQLKRYGAHTRNELAMLRHFIRPGDTILDVGAHIGTFSIPLAFSAGGEGKVYAFEPNVLAFELLVENVKANDLEMRVGCQNLVVSHSNEHYRCSAINVQNTGATAYRRISECEVDPERAECSQRSVSLDTWYTDHAVQEAIDVLKIDTEGMELDVL